MSKETTDSSERAEHSQATNSGVSSRRTILRNVAAGLATTAGISMASQGVAAARHEFTAEERRQALDDYQSQEALESVFADHEDALATLNDEGLLETTSARELLEASNSPETSVSVELKPYRQTDGTPTPELLVRRDTDEGLLVFGVRPEIDQRFATVTPESGDHRDIDDVTTMACCRDCCTVIVCCDCQCCNPCLCPPDCNGTCYVCCGPSDEYC